MHDVVRHLPTALGKQRGLGNGHVSRTVHVAQCSGTRMFDDDESMQREYAALSIGPKCSAGAVQGR